MAPVGFLLAGALWLLAPATTTPAAAQSLDYRGVLEYAGGRYVFDRYADSWYLGNGLSLQTGRLRFSVDVPLVLHDEEAIAYSGGMAVPVGGARGRTQGGSGSGSGSGSGAGMGNGSGSGSGMGGGGSGGMVYPLPASPGYRVDMGDPFAAVSAEIYEGFGALRGVELTASVKVPVADTASGVGTGAWDMSAGASVTLSPARRWLLFLDGAYWHLGNSPGLPLNDAFAYGAALGTTLGGGRWGVIAGVAGSTVVVPGTAAPAAATLSLMWSGQRRRALTLSGRAGLTDSAPDFAISLGWRLPIGR